MSIEKSKPERSTFSKARTTTLIHVLKAKMNELSRGLEFVSSFDDPSDGREEIGGTLRKQEGNDRSF